jgi:hypothetical protein
VGFLLAVSAPFFSQNAPNAAPAPPPPPTPRLSDGKVNFGRVVGEKGTWDQPYIQNMGAPNIFVGAPQPQRGAGGRGGGGMRGGAPSEPWIPFRPWAAAVYNYNSKNESKYDPQGFCLPPGGPRIHATPYPMEMLHLPERIVQIFEGGAHIWREIYMDGRPHPPQHEIKGQTWIGHSVGHYEGNDTLVVDTRGFNEGTWIDYYGKPHTDDLHVIERYTRPDKNTLHYEATIDDPGAYTRPWTVAWNIPWDQDGQLQEYICQENNQYMIDLKDDFGKPFLTPSLIE